MSQKESTKKSCPWNSVVADFLGSVVDGAPFKGAASRRWRCLGHWLPTLVPPEITSILIYWYIAYINICICMHIYIHTSMHTYLHAYLRTYVYSNIRQQVDINSNYYLRICWPVFVDMLSGLGGSGVHMSHSSFGFTMLHPFLSFWSFWILLRWTPCYFTFRYTDAQSPVRSKVGTSYVLEIHLPFGIQWAKPAKFQGQTHREFHEGTLPEPHPKHPWDHCDHR